MVIFFSWAFFANFSATIDEISDFFLFKSFISFSLDEAEIKVIFEGCEPPEGVMRINDQLVKTIGGKDEKPTTE